MGQLNAQADYFNQQTELNYNINEDASYARFLEEAPIFVEYYSQNQVETTTDSGFGNVNNNIGDQAKKFNKISNIPLYGVDKAQWDMNDDEYGIRASFESSGTLIPDTVIPVPEDYLKVHYHSNTYIFKVTSITIDTIKSNNYYKIEFKYDSEKGELIENQVVANYTCIFDRIGTQLKSVLRNDIIDLINKVTSVYDTVADDYISLFYDDLPSTLVYKSNLTPTEQIEEEQNDKNYFNEDSASPLFPGTCVGAINYTNPIITTPPHDKNDLDHKFHSDAHKLDHAIHRFDETKCYNNEDNHKNCIYHEEFPVVINNDESYSKEYYNGNRFYDNYDDDISDINIYDPYVIEFIISNDLFIKHNDFKSYTFTHVIRKPANFTRCYRNSIFYNVLKGKPFRNAFRVTKIQDEMSYFYLGGKDYFNTELFTGQCPDLYRREYTKFRYNYRGKNLIYNTIIEYLRLDKNNSIDFLNKFIEEYTDFYGDINRDCFILIPIVLFIIKSLLNNITIKTINKGGL